MGFEERILANCDRVCEERMRVVQRINAGEKNARSTLLPDGSKAPAGQQSRPTGMATQSNGLDRIKAFRLRQMGY